MKKSYQQESNKKNSLQTLIPFVKVTAESYHGTKPDRNFDDEWKGWKNQIEVPKNLAQSITKETCKKLGV